MVELEQPRRGRPPRAAIVDDTERRERRRAAVTDADEDGSKIAIPGWVREKFPETQYTYRWFTSTPARMLWAHQNDWDVVDGADRVPTADKTGAPCEQVLHVKHRDWFDSDRAPREERRRELERQMERGAVKAQGEDSGETLSERHQYAEAASQNRLS